jgi:hypothetical protein
VAVGYEPPSARSEETRPGCRKEFCSPGLLTPPQTQKRLGGDVEQDAVGNFSFLFLGFNLQHKEALFPTPLHNFIIPFGWREI